MSTKTKRLVISALLLAAGLIIRYQKVLFEGDEIPERFTRTFGAGEGWKDLPL